MSPHENGGVVESSLMVKITSLEVKAEIRVVHSRLIEMLTALVYPPVSEVELVEPGSLENAFE